MTSTIQQILDNVYGNISEPEYKHILSIFFKNYYHQPNSLRWLMTRGHGTLYPVEYDDRQVFEMPILKDVEALDIRTDIPDKTLGLTVEKAIGRLVQMGGNFKISEDTKNTPYMGNDRVNLITRQIAEKMVQQEDILFLKGDTSTGIDGIISKATAVTTNGAWGVASSGILTNVQKDLKDLLTEIDNQGLPAGPIDIVLPNILYNLLSTEIKVYGDQVALDYFRPMLRGGDFFATNNINASITQDKVVTSSSVTGNTVLAFYRTPLSFIYGKASYPKWAVTKIGFNEQHDFRQKMGFAYPVTSKFVYKIQNVSAASS